MSTMSNLDRHLRDLIQILINKNVSVIYPTEVAHLLQCSVGPVQDILFRMVEEEILQHVYELHCCRCGEVMDILATPRLLTSAPFPCPHCLTQMESITMNDVVSAFKIRKRAMDSTALWTTLRFAPG